MSALCETARTVRGRLIRLAVQRQGRDRLVTIAGGDAPHVGCAALAADGQTRRLDRAGHREGEIAASLAGRASARLDCAVCVVCGIHFDAITREEIAAVLAAVEDMADAWLDMEAGTSPA